MNEGEFERSAQEIDDLIAASRAEAIVLRVEAARESADPQPDDTDSPAVEAARRYRLLECQRLLMRSRLRRNMLGKFFVDQGVL